MTSPFEGVEISVGANNGRRTMKASPLSDKPTQKNGNEEQIRKKITKQPKTCIPPYQTQGYSPEAVDAYGRRVLFSKRVA